MLFMETFAARERVMDPRMPDGSSPFESEDCGHVPCPPWLADEQAPVALHDATTEPELDPPHHVHDLWVALGLGEE
jgi:hypothetical protein